MAERSSLRDASSFGPQTSLLRFLPGRHRQNGDHIRQSRRGHDIVNSRHRLEEAAGRLSAISRESRYDAFTAFEWPQSLPDDGYWMSPELLSCYDTPIWASLDDERRVRLSQREAVNFFSLNVELIRDLIAEVACASTPLDTLASPSSSTTSSPRRTSTCGSSRPSATATVANPTTG